MASNKTEKARILLHLKKKMIRRLWLMRTTKTWKKKAELSTAGLVSLAFFLLVLLVVFTYNTYRPHVPTKISKIKKSRRRLFFFCNVLSSAGHPSFRQLERCSCSVYRSGCDSRQRSRPCSVWLYKSSRAQIKKKMMANLKKKGRNVPLGDISGV